MFKSEEQLVEKCIPFIYNFFCEKKDVDNMLMIREPKGLFGIPDLMLYNGKVISIEFKLSNWKKAMEQAFRYKSFSFQSYVFLDNHYISRALANIDEFQRYNIGLCGVENDEIVLYFKPNDEHPYCGQLKDKALKIFEQM